eukprot:COSAG02_NODE_6739_length_3392_cov_4.852111_4_plen_226_part_00
MCAKLGFARAVSEAECAKKRVQQEWEQELEPQPQPQPQQQHTAEEERQQQDYALARSTRALLRRGSICMHEFFSAVCNSLCAKWAEVPSEVLHGSSFEQCATSLAPKEWAEFQRRFAARLRLEAVRTAPSTSAIASSTSRPVSGDGEVLAEQEDRHLEVSDDLIESIRAECSRSFLPVDMGSGVVDGAWRSIATQGDWRPFDALVGALAEHSSRHHNHVSLLLRK